MKVILFIILVFPVLFSCGSVASKEGDNGSKVDSLPDGAVRIEYRRHIYFAGAFDDSIQGNFIFDTGASHLLIDSFFYSRANVTAQRRVGNAILPGAGTQKQRIRCIFDTVNFCFNKLCFSSPVVPLFNLKDIVGCYADGIVGIGFLDKQVFEINYAEKYVRFIKPENFVVPEGYEAIRMDRRGDRLFVKTKAQITAALSIDADLLLDLGSGGSVSFGNKIAEKNTFGDVITKKYSFYSTQGGVGGETSGYEFLLPKFQIGSFILSDMDAGYSNDKNGALSGNAYDGLLGNGVLEKFDVIIDFPNNILYLKPNENYEVPFDKTGIGFSAVDRADICNGWVVNGLIKGLEAEEKGIKPNDIITHVNGKPVTDFFYSQLHELYRQAGVPVEFTVKRGGGEVFTVAITPVALF